MLLYGRRYPAGRCGARGPSLIFSAFRGLLLVFGTVGSMAIGCRYVGLMAIGCQYLAPLLVPKNGVLSTDSWS